MGVPAFNTHSLTCPTCNRTSEQKLGDELNGLYTCPHCKTQLVVCWSGHFVRDPAKDSRITLVGVLRRQSQPIARLARDLGTIPIVSLVSVVVIGGIALAMGFGSWERQPQLDPDTVQPKEQAHVLKF